MISLQGGEWIIKIGVYQDNGGRMPKGEKAEVKVDGRRQFLVHLDADIIRRVKILAIERGVSASSLVSEAMTEFLRRSGDARPTD